MTANVLAAWRGAGLSALKPIRITNFQTNNNMSNEEQNPASCQTAVCGSGYIHNPVTVDEIANNANIQMGNIEYYLSIKDFQSALIKAHCLVSELQDIMALQIGSEIFKSK